MTPAEASAERAQLEAAYARQLEISCDRETLGRHAFTREQARDILAGYRDGLRHAFELLVPGVAPTPPQPPIRVRAVSRGASQRAPFSFHFVEGDAEAPADDGKYDVELTLRQALQLMRYTIAGDAELREFERKRLVVLRRVGGEVASFDLTERGEAIVSALHELARR